MVKGLSRMKGNFHVRFLGGWRVVTLSGYPVGEARRSGRSSALPSRRGARTAPGRPAACGGSPAAARYQLLH